MVYYNLLFIELQIKEHRQFLEKEAERIRISRSSRAQKRKLMTRGVEKFANLLIAAGEFLKRKYGPMVSVQTDSSGCLVKNPYGFR